MKKFLISLAVCLLASASAMADSKVTSGDVSVLKQPGTSFSVEFDFSKTIVEGVPYKEYVASRNDNWRRDWPKDQNYGIEIFCKKWSKKNKKGMTAVTSGGDYRMVIKPTELHFGSAAMAMTIGFGAGGMKLSGTMELYKGNECILVIKVVDQTGKSSMSETMRFRSLMEELADDTYSDILK